jgi:hypothetical protein
MVDAPAHRRCGCSHRRRPWGTSRARRRPASCCAGGNARQRSGRCGGSGAPPFLCGAAAGCCGQGRGGALRGVRKWLPRGAVHCVLPGSCVRAALGAKGRQEEQRCSRGGRPPPRQLSAAALCARCTRGTYQVAQSWGMGSRHGRTWQRGRQGGSWREARPAAGRARAACGWVDGVRRETRTPQLPRPQASQSQRGGPCSCLHVNCNHLQGAGAEQVGPAAAGGARAEPPTCREGRRPNHRRLMTLPTLYASIHQRDSAAHNFSSMFSMRAWGARACARATPASTTLLPS